MASLTVLLVIVFPLTILGQYIAGKYVSPGLEVSAVIATAALGLFAMGHYRLRTRRNGWFLWTCLFLVVGIFSMLLSPYRSDVLVKGSAQIVGITISALTAFVIQAETEHNPWLLFKLMKLASVLLGALGVLAVAQSLYFNEFGTGGFLDFTFMNSIAGGSVWRDPGSLGSMYRANAIFPEPAEFCRYLSLIVGISLVRIGILGSKFRQALRGIVPGWSAWMVLAGYAVSVSMLGFLVVIASGTACWMIAGRMSLRSTLGTIRYVLLAIALMSGIALVAGTGFERKLSSVALLLPNGERSDTQSFDSTQVSALAIAANLDVAATNVYQSPWLGIGLGGHPISYKDAAPSYAIENRDIYDLNAEDAASLLLRLLSETGLIGTTIFVWMVANIVMRSRNAVLVALDETHSLGTRPPLELIALSVGIAASLSAVFLLYLARAGQYYELPLWMLIGLSSAVPGLLSPGRSSSSRFPPKWAKGVTRI